MRKRSKLGSSKLHERAWLSIGVGVGISACRDLVATAIHYDTLPEFTLRNTVSCGTKVKDL